MEDTAVFNRLEAFRAAQLQLIKEHKERSGKIVAFFNRYFPPALLAGMDLWPVRITNGTDEEMETRGEQLVRPDTCPFCKCILGNFLARTNLHSCADLIVGTITCDQMRRTLEHLGNDLKIPIFPVQVPATITDESVEYYRRGMQIVVENIAHHLGLTVDFNTVKQYENNRAEIAHLLKPLLLESKLSPLFIHKLTQFFAWTQPAPLLGFMKEHLPRMTPYNPRYNIVVTGSVFSEEDDSVVRFLAKEHIGYIPVHSTGLYALECLERLDGIPDEQIYQTLTSRYFTCSLDIRTRPNGAVYEHLKHIVAATNARGVILKTLTFCDLWYTEKERMSRALPVPVLVLNSGFGPGNELRTNARLEAFFEMVS